MRFELYSFTELFGSYRYRFCAESDTAEELLLYIVKTPLEDGGWIYLDNLGERDGFLSLGFVAEPTEEECLKRVFYCKLSRELYKEGSREPVWDNGGFEDVAEEGVRRAQRASEEFCQKFIQEFRL